MRCFNKAFEKRVHVWSTEDDWSHVREVAAVHVPGGDNLADRFMACISLPDSHAQVQFALRYEVAGETYWSNNDGKNFTLELATCRAKETSRRPPTPPRHFALVAE